MSFKNSQRCRKVREKLMVRNPDRYLLELLRNASLITGPSVIVKRRETKKARFSLRNYLTLESCSPNSSNFCCRGVLISSVATMASLILPMAVLAPVPITTPLALPEETLVPEKTMFFLSWLTALGSGTGSQCLITETDSPVRMDWSILMSYLLEFGHFLSWKDEDSLDFT